MILPDIRSHSSKTRIRYFSGSVWSVPVMSKSLTRSGAAPFFLKALTFSKKNYVPVASAPARSDGSQKYPLR